jgi:DNA processing protein
VPDDERRARRALACVVEAGNARLAALVPKAGAEEVWRMLSASARTATTDASGDPWVRRAALLDLDAVEAAERRGGMRFVIPGDAEWPVRLADLLHCPPVQDMGGAPVGLWVRGSVSFADAVASSVAVVGSRASTPYGDRVASGLAADLTSVGITVVSGGAYGIDAAAHRGALSEGGPTVAFLAGGVDEPYPRMNAGLLEEVARHGVLVSEYPPGAHPTRPRFLARNRLIAAASEGTVIVEAAARSGARNTVTWAGGCSRAVMAVPGPIGNSTSFTPHRLIRAGEAVLVTSADEVREQIRPLGSVEEWRPPSERLLDTLTDQQRAAYEALPSRGVRDVGDLSVRAALRMPECLAALDVLATGGLAVRHNDGRWGLGKVGDRPLLPFETTGRAPRDS